MRRDDEAPGRVPERHTGLRLGRPATSAGGVPAVIQVARHTLRQMNPLRGLSVLSQVNQVEGFDCPGCAWPEPTHRGAIEFCENGAKAIAEEATTRRVDPAFFARWSVAQLRAQSDRWLGQQGRLTHPMVLRPGATHYQPIGWDEAFGLIAAQLAAHQPDQAVFYTSGRTSNEAAFLYQLLVRRHGTNNLPDCSNMCHESSGMGMSAVIGVGKGTVTLEDFQRADCIMVIGHNPGTNHPRMLSALMEAARGGCRIISINPMKEAGLLRFKHPQEVVGLVGGGQKLSSRYLQVRINGDVALLKGFMKGLLAIEERTGGALDRAFIDEFTDGFEALKEDLEQTAWGPLEAASGISRAEMEEVAATLAGARRGIICWAMGLTQHRNGLANIREVINLLLMRGWMGVPGAGACPVRGHSNVQGDRTMGIWEAPPESFLQALEQHFGFTAPRAHGYATVPAIKAMHEGRARVFFAMGGNFLSASPDTDFTARALARTALTVQVSTKLNRSHLVTGACGLILPCLGRTERDVQRSGPQFVSCENSMGVVQRSRGRLEPASPMLLSEPAIVARLAVALFGSGDSVPWLDMIADYDRIRDAIEAVIPGFEDYNRRVRRAEGLVLPNPARERVFRTETGTARFTVHPLPSLAVEEGQLVLMTTRSHDQYNTTIYGLDDRYRGVYGERRVLFMHRDDMAARGIAARQPVDITSHFQDEERHAWGFLAVPHDLPRGCVAAYFPEANVLIPVDSVAEGSLTPTSKSIIVTVAPARG